MGKTLSTSLLGQRADSGSEPEFVSQGTLEHAGMLNAGLPWAGCWYAGTLDVDGQRQAFFVGCVSLATPWPTAAEPRR